MNRIKVMLIDDSAVVRQVVVGLLQADPGIEVIGAAADPLFALDRMKKQWPDVILLDVEMPRMNGIEATRQLKESNPDAEVVILTKFGDDENVFSAIKGAKGGAH